MSSQNIDETGQGTELPITETFPKPTPDVGLLYRAESGVDLDDACLGTVARFPDGSVVVQSFEHVNQDVREGTAFYDDGPDALIDFEEAFPDADVWIDWESQ